MAKEKVYNEFYVIVDIKDKRIRIDWLGREMELESMCCRLQWLRTEM